jgi:FkbM family methyltransferase
MNGKTALQRFFRASFRRYPKAVAPAGELHTADFAPQYKPEDHWLVKYGIRTILDVGAHIGEFAQRIRAILPDANLVCFEPLREPYLELSRRFAGQPNFLAVQCALGEEAGQCEIHHNEYAPSSSLLPMTDLHKRSFTFAVKENPERIEVRRLSDVARELNLRDPLLLKLDVQGFEDKVVLGGEDVVARAKIIIVEVSFLPLYEGGPLFEDIYQILKTRGFVYNGNFDQLLSPADGRPLQADAIFTRP